MNKQFKCDAEIKTGKLEQACQRYNIGRTYMRQIAEEAGAVIHIGKILLINFSIMDQYFDALSGDK